MSYFTLLFGLGLIGLGLFNRFGAGLTSVTTLIPAVFGLAYMTFGEGMRTLPKHRRLFLFLSILLTLLAMAGSIKGALQLPAALRGEELVRDNNSRLTPQSIYVQVAMLALTGAYLCLALLLFFRANRQLAVPLQPNLSPHAAPTHAARSAPTPIQHERESTDSVGQAT
jgi:hypothetical protein